MNIIPFFTYTIILLWLFSRWKLVWLGLNKPLWSLVLFGIRLLCGLAIQFYYMEAYGGGDIYSFFQDAKILNSSYTNSATTYFSLLSGIELPGNNTPFYTSIMDSWGHYSSGIGHYGNRLMIRLNSIFLLLSQGNIYIHTLFFSTISFVGLCFVHKAFSSIHQALSNKLLIVILLLPSGLMWSTTGFKEAVLTLSIGITLFVLFQHIQKPSLTKLVGLSLLILFNCLFKIYIGAALAISITSLLISMKTNWKPTLVYIISFASLSIVGYLGVSLFTKSDIPTQIFEQQQKAVRYAKGGLYARSNERVIIIPFEKVSELAIEVRPKYYRLVPDCSYTFLPIGKFDEYSVFTHKLNDTTTYKLVKHIEPTTNVIPIPLLKDRSTVELFKNIPNAFWVCITSPSLAMLDKKTFFPFAENLILLLFIILVIVYRNKKTPATLWFFFISTAILIYIILGLTSVALGTLVRQKTPAILILLLGLLLILDTDKVGNIIRKPKPK